MINPPTSDDEVIAQMRDRERRARWVVYLVAFAPVVGCTIAVTGGRGTMNVASWWAVGVAGSVVLAGFAWLLWQRPPPAVYRPRIVARRTDEMQRGRSRQLWAYPIIIVCLAPQIIMARQYALDRGGPRPLGLPRGVATISYFLVLAICLLTTVVATGMMLMGAGYPKTIRPVMDDELSRAYRAKAIASGFLASFVGGIAALGARLIEPRWAVPGLPFVITGSLAVAAVHFALLERRADLSG
jgi:hypothetical protein